MNKKRVGIITFFYSSINYGAVLQAYALSKFLNSHGYDTKQILYDETENGNSNIEKNSIKKMIKVIYHLLVRIIKYQNIRLITNIEKDRRKAFENLKYHIIPHTEKKYTSIDINTVNKDFDVFITGSDQVFNYTYAKSDYFLSFVNNDKERIAYAASMALDGIDEYIKPFLIKELNMFKAISIREEKTIDLLNKLINRDISLTVDPTLLLEKEEWDSISSTRIIDKKYVFCYFLEKGKEKREYAIKYANENRLLLISIPVARTKYSQLDMNFGNLVFPSASPEDFISLIKNSECVFTDSFHACTFSFIYKKPFVVFDRDTKGTMNSRIKTLMKILNTEDRYINRTNINNYEYINQIVNSNVFSNDRFEKYKNESIEFLIKNI